MSRTMAVHVCYNSEYIPLRSSAKQQRVLANRDRDRDESGENNNAKFYVLWRTRTVMVVIFRIFFWN